MFEENNKNDNLYSPSSAELYSSNTTKSDKILSSKTHIIANRHQRFFGPLEIICIICCVITVILAVMLVNTQMDLNKVKNDFGDCWEISKNAQKDSSYKSIAKITAINYDTKTGKYYIEYKTSRIEILSGGTTMELKNESKSRKIYSSNKGFEVNEEIAVALSCLNTELNENSKVVPLDFCEYDLEDDGEYKVLLKTRKTDIIAVAIIGSISLLLTIVSIVLKAKRNFKINTMADEIELNFNRVIKDNTEQQERTQRCMYCGQVNSIDAIVCISCNGKLK